MIKIRIEKRENLDRALKQLKRLCNDAGVFREIKKTSYYEKPSERRRREAQQRLKNIFNAQKKRRQKFRRRQGTPRL